MTFTKPESGRVDNTLLDYYGLQNMPFINYNGKNILFIHIPKTGGTSIARWMQQFGELNLHCTGIPPFSKCTPQHYTGNDIKSLFGDEFFQYSFTVVRNPYHRLESEYKMRWLIARESFFGEFPRLSQWIEKNLDIAQSNKWFLDSHLRPQTDFLASGVRRFNFEDGLDFIIETVARETGLPFNADIPFAYSSKDFPEKIMWDQQDLMLVNAFYQWDFKNLGYQMRNA